MTTADMIKISTSLASETAVSIARLGRLLRSVLFFSLADERIVSRRQLFILPENGSVSVVLRSKFLSRMTTRGVLRYPFEAGGYPPPENLAATAALAAKALKAEGAEVTLVAPKAWAIVKTVEFPLVVKDTLPDVIAYELDRLTPLSPERALYDFVVLAETGSRLCVLLAAVNSERLRPYLDALKERGITVGQVAVETDQPGGDPLGAEPATEGINLLAKGVHRQPKPPLALTILLGAVLIAAGLFWMVSPLQTEEQRIALIDREIAARKGEVGKVETLKKELEGLEKEIAAINAFRTSRPLTLDLLKEMTRVLPDNVWLSRVRLTESAIEIEGYAASAADTLQKLEDSPYFKKVEFASPTTRDARLKADRFIIKMEVEGLPEQEERNEQKR
ncbi:MAG: PilN domain-containing protein [Syntrophales bacterium]